MLASNPSQYVPQTGSNRRPLVAWMLLAISALVFCGVIVAAPIAEANGHHFVAASIYQAFSRICHQIPERSFFIAGHQFAVCSRCTGIYAGFTLLLLLYPLITSLRRTHTPQRKWLFLSLVPMAIDLGVRILGIWENTHTSRFFTGALFGGVAVFYVVPGVLDLSLMLRRKSHEHSFRRPVTLTVSAEQAANAPSDYSAPARRI